MKRQYVIDASMGYRDGLFVFCPIEGDIAGEFTVITGLMLGSKTPPHDGRLVAIWHPEGQDAVEAFALQYEAELAELQKTIEEREAYQDYLTQPEP